MGYTHYWEHTKAFDDNQWTQIVNAYCDMFQATIIQGVLLSFDEEEKQASGHAILEERTKLLNNHSLPIYFNGVEDNAHETFVLYKNGPPRGSFDFCKTAYKPYDILVTAMLTYLESQFGDHISVSSDGDENDWEKGLRLAKDTLNHPITLPKCFEKEEDEDE